jgi:hypothetical protein
MVGSILQTALECHGVVYESWYTDVRSIAVKKVSVL